MKTISGNDLNILATIFAGSSANIFLAKSEANQFTNLSDNVHIIGTTEVIGTYEGKKILFLFNAGAYHACRCHFSFDYVIVFGKESLKKHEFDLATFNYINNADGTMRWVYPQANKSPMHLAFYNSIQLKAFTYKAVTSAAYALGCKSVLADGKFKVYTKGKYEFENATRSIFYSDYAVFTGTVGPNRKCLFALGKKNKVNSFLKLGITSTSVQLIENEKMAISAMQSKLLQGIIIPKVQSTTKEALVIDNIKPSQRKRSSAFSVAHAQAALAIVKSNMISERIEQTDFDEQLKNNLFHLQHVRPMNAMPYLNDTVSQLREIYQSLDRSENAIFSVAHGDFTPWNMYVANTGVHLYDWELSKTTAPALFDVFHYVFQEQVLLKHKGIKAIEEEIERILHLPTISAFIHQHQINVQLHYKLYLLYNISYYLNIYANQPQLHQQAHWLMEVWHQALKPLEPVANDGKMRHAFIKSLFEKMHQTKYAILKFTHSELSEINEYSDIDMIVLRNDRNKIVSYATTHPMVWKCKVYRKSFMTTVELYFKDQSFLSLDLITDFHRKDLQYIDARKFFTAIRYTFEKVKLPEERFCFEYTWLFYLLNASHMPPKYVAYYQSMSDTVKQHILNHIKSSYGLSIVSIEECFRHTKTLRAEVLKSLATKRSNSFTKRLKRKVNYYIDTIKDLVDRRGIVITFSGVDGAGKSTIINEVKHMLSEKFRKKVVVLRHRPSVVPILSALTLGKKKAEEISVSRLPRTGTNKNILLSYIRFAYYYSDYLLGQLYVFAKYSMRGYVVLYDRYYFDFIIDAKRSNMVLNENVTSWLYRFIYHPTLNLFLYAPVHIIKARKQELDDQAIEQLTSGYKKLFSKMSLNYQQRYIPLENVDKAQTLKFIEQEIIKAA